ncbi:hypothetical protein C8J57DRAFT_1539945 [Mycena rebaudengoi]|nr:hypothetical protein C8J57DRAFT_1539945 [Mycena rebaudengoi]
MDSSSTGRRQERWTIVDTWFGRAAVLLLSLDWLRATIGHWSGQVNAVIRRHAPRLQVLNRLSHLPESMPFHHLDIADLDDIHPLPALTALHGNTAASACLARKCITIGIDGPPAATGNLLQLQQSPYPIVVVRIRPVHVVQAASSLRKLNFYGCSFDDSFRD